MIFFLAFLVILLVTTLVAGPVITRIDQRWRDKKQRKLMDLAADIEQVFEAAAPPATEATPQVEAPTPAEPAPVSAPRIDLDALPEEEAEAGATERTRTRS